MRKKLLILAALTSVVLVRRADAANCSWTWSQGTTINFGIYTALTASPQVDLPFTYTCNGQATVTITLSTGGSGSFSPRKMSPGNTVGYNLYLDSPPTTVWGNGGTTSYIRDTPGGLQVQADIYAALVPATQDVPAGVYTDTVTAHMTFVQGAKMYTVTPDVSLSVRIEVKKDCKVSTFNVSFGQYDPLSPTDTVTPSASAITVTCTTGTRATVALDNGLNPSGGVRNMTATTGDLLAYELFQDQALANSWGTATITGQGPNSPVQLTVYGRITKGQDVGPGSYKDTVQATVTY